MDSQSNAAPIIIKKKINIIESGHHGGAWKVAYADFVTAMMAFFLLMWLLNATTEQQRKGLADYFNPSVIFMKNSSGGTETFNGDSVTTDNTLSQSGSGVASGMEAVMSATGEMGGKNDKDLPKPEELIRAIEKKLLARTGESMTMRRLLRHVVSRATDEGVILELFDTKETRLFSKDTDQPKPELKMLISIISNALEHTHNQLAINGHLRSFPMALKDSPVWQLSSKRAQTTHQLLLESGMADERIQRVTGYADRKTVTPDPSKVRNNRLEIILLRKDR